jgi:hypothetical protein
MQIGMRAVHPQIITGFMDGFAIRTRPEIPMDNILTIATIEDNYKNSGRKPC